MYIVMMEATISGLHRLLKRVDYTIQEVNCSLRKVLGGRNEGFSGDSLQTSVYCRFFAIFCDKLHQLLMPSSSDANNDISDIETRTPQVST